MSEKINLFFESMAERLTNENDLSDITYALCKTDDDFRKFFLEYCFESPVYTDNLIREYADEGSRPDFYFIGRDNNEYLIEVKIYDRIAVTAMENSRKNIENISTSLKETGVNEKDISISESMIAIENGRYVISTRLKVLIRNIKIAPAIIDSSMGNGKASELVSYKLLVSDISDLEKQVRLSAIQNAYDNAKLTATANGVSLGPVTMIQDITNHLTANYVNNEDQTITLASSVYINYELTNE